MPNFQLKIIMQRIMRLICYTLYKELYAGDSPDGDTWPFTLRAGF